MLDLDDTLIPWKLKTRQKKEQAQIVHDLLNFCDEHSIPYAINTARTQPSFYGMESSLIKRLSNVPYCYRTPGSSVTDSKKECMIQMSKGKGRNNVFLMDDKQENCDAVRKSSFNSIHVTPNGRGIQRKDVNCFIDSVSGTKNKRRR